MYIRSESESESEFLCAFTAGKMQVPEEAVRNHYRHCANLRASLTAAECECRLGLYWCKAMALGRQLPIHSTDVAVITVSSLVCLTNMLLLPVGAIATYIATPSVVCGLAIISLPSEHSDTR